MNSKRILALLLASVLLLGLFSVGASANSAAIIDLKTNGRVEPLGVDTAQPAFSWKMQSDAIGAAQKSYRIVVTSADDAVVWDSGTVESAVSVGIVYAGEALQPCTAYSWTVTVTNQKGETLVSEAAHFETSLLSDSFDAWDGAQWIGAEALPLDAASKSVFRIAADVTIPEGSEHASFLLGANDFRLRNASFNPWLAQGENYIRVELDYSGVTAEGGAKINFYRVGYLPDDDATTPVDVIEGNEALDAAVNASNAHDTHHIELYCPANGLIVSVDGTQLNANRIVLNPLGGAECNTYPMLSAVGFAAEAGESAVFENYQIENAGKYARGVLFAENTGATYAIFNGLYGLTVNGASITCASVDGQSVTVYTDPGFGSEPTLRRSFNVESNIAKARLYITAQGIYDVSLNGEAIAPDDWFNPGASEYDQLLAYSVYDVTAQLRPGENVMDAVLGEGWWTGMMTFETTNNNYYGDQPALMAKLVIDYADGTSETLVTDESWQVAIDGPVRLASLFQGERYDATAEASDWQSAVIVHTRAQFASPRLVTRCDEPVHVIRELTAVECLGEAVEGSGSYIYDMGENLVGVPAITIPASYATAGETLTIRYAEILYPALSEYVEQGVSGLLMVENLRSALATDFYTMTDGEQVFSPRLTFHGYRYIEISGLDEPLPAECVGMKVLSSLDATASYDSSNELTNRLFANIVNSTTGNYLSLPTDCPQRDERLGWTGDAQVYALSASYVADTYNFMRQWMDTVRADCGETGLSSQYCPAFVQYDVESDDPIPHNGQSFGITWNCLVVTIPYNLYLQTGDTAIVSDNIENIKAYVDHLLDTPLTYKDAKKKKQTEPRLTGETGTLCDHLARVPSDSVSLGNSVFIACLDEAAAMCEAVGDTAKAEEYRAAAVDAREAWNALFLDPDSGMTRSAKGVIQDTQASYATPLRYGIISEENLPRVLEHYLRTIAEPNLTDSDGLTVPPYTITTGFNATGNVLPALTKNGLSDAAYKLFESTEYASWLYPVTQGATSIWERWNGYTEELGFNGNNGMNSFNHYSFGAVCEWMTAYQLGIKADPDAPGYQHFILQPMAGGSFTYAKGSYESPYGAIVSGWTAEGGVMSSYEVTVPANTTATLYLPAQSVSVCEGVTLTGQTAHNGTDCAELELAAGSYRFEIADGAAMASIQ